jgi:citrate lyase subunit beta/citryl-CoA lyase
MARRSVLFAPADKPDLLHKTLRTDADVVVFDLEDAVAPARKAAAREAVAEVLADIDDPGAEVVVRVNPGVAAGADLDAVSAGSLPDALMLPKAESAAAVEGLAERASEHGATLPVFAIAETAAGVLHAEDIAAADPTTALVFGAEDLSADVGATRTRDGREVDHARQQVVLAAAAAGVDALDTLVTDYEADDHLREDAALSRQLGYDGKLAIHPRQVPIINDAFTPDPERVEWAQRVLDARDAADADDRGVFAVDGEMIDAPLVAQAERVVERARAGGIL